MRYFIESVSTLNTTGKSRKGALLQTIAKRFEHTIIKGDDALCFLVNSLRALVDACNASFRGKNVTLDFSPYGHYIHAKNDNTGHDSYIFAISYAPVGDEFCFYDIPDAVISSVENLCGHDFAMVVASAEEKIRATEKGGEK